MPWVWLLASALTTADVRMDSFADELTLGSAHQPATGVRSGFFSDRLEASLTLDDRWLLGASYTLSAVQSVGFTHTPELDATLLLNRHLALTLSANGSPPSQTLFPLCVSTGKGRSFCIPLSETLWSTGGNALASWDSGGDSNFEWGVDGAYSPVYYSLQYQTTLSPKHVDEELWQHRFGGGATGHLFHWVDVDLRGAYYLYSGANLNILELALTQLTGGLPIAPRRWEAAANVTGYFLARKLSVRVSLLVGPYAATCLGSGTQLSVKLSGQLGPVRLWGMALSQSDLPPSNRQVMSACTAALGSAPVSSLSAYATLGAEYGF